MTIKDLIEDSWERLGLRQIAGYSGVTREIKDVQVQICRDNEELLNNLIPEIPLIITSSYLSHLEAISYTEVRRIFQKILYCKIPCLAFSQTFKLTGTLLHFSEQCGIPFLISTYDEYFLESRMIGLLREKICKTVTVCGSLVSAAGIGVLIMGDSGIGKTECCIELVERGYFWIADDIVEIERRDGNILCGRSNICIKNLLEIKGRGVLQAEDIFSAAAIRIETIVNMILEYERLFKSSDTCDNVLSKDIYVIMGVKIPYFRITVPSYRNNLADYVDAAVNDYLSARSIS